MLSVCAAFGVTALSWLSSARFWLLAVVVAFVVGAALGSAYTVRIYAAAHEQALEDQRVTLEAAKKAAYELAVKDTEERLAKNKVAETTAVKIKRAVIRVPGTCDISADSMKKLNDPALVGETQ